MPVSARSLALSYRNTSPAAALDAPARRSDVENFVGLLVLLLLTRVCGTLAERGGQAPAVGELIAGIALAALAAVAGGWMPALPAFIGSELLSAVANLGIFFLMLLVGIELKPKEIADQSAGSLAVAAGGMVVPLAAGIALAWVLLTDSESKQAQALLVGVAMAITAVPATVKVFSELGVLHAPVGRIVVSAAIFDDVIGLVLLAVLTAVIETGHIPDAASLALLLIKVAAFFMIAVGLGTHVYPRLRRGLKVLQIAALEFSTLIAVALAYALLAQALGLHWILGAFMAGLFFEPARVGGRAYNEMKLVVTGVTSGLLGPLFFATIGLRVDLQAIAAVPLFVAVLVAIALAGKVIGAGLPAMWVGLERREVLAVGVGMSARGAVELVVLGVAFDAGLFAATADAAPLVAHLFSALVLMAVATTLLAPIALRQVTGCGGCAPLVAPFVLRATTLGRSRCANIAVARQRHALAAAVKRYQNCLRCIKRGVLVCTYQY